MNLLPEMMPKTQAYRWKLVLVSAIILDMVICWQHSMNYYNKKDFRIGNNGDAFLTYGPTISPTGYAAAQLIAYLASSVPAHATLAVLPEGVMINYLSRHPNPVPFFLVNPFEMQIYGEKAILSRFEKTPPEYIVLVHRDSREHGADFFGLSCNYGKETMNWINSRYQPVWHILAEPLKDGQFGIKMLQLNSPKKPRDY